MSAPAGVWILALSNSQKIALVDLILEHMLAKSCSEEFVDCSTPDAIVTRPRDILLLLDKAAWISEEKLPAFVNSADFSKIITLKTPANAKS